MYGISQIFSIILKTRIILISLICTTHFNIFGPKSSKRDIISYKPILYSSNIKQIEFKSTLPPPHTQKKTPPDLSWLRFISQLIPYKIPHIISEINHFLPIINFVSNWLRQVLGPNFSVATLSIGWHID